MSSFLQSVDERTKLAGTNKLEMLMFSLGKNKETGKKIFMVLMCLNYGK